MKVRFLEDAISDVNDILEWYDRIDKELSEGFVRDLKKSIEFVKERPYANKKVSSDTFRSLLPTFPYMFFYSINSLRGL